MLQLFNFAILYILNVSLLKHLIKLLFDSIRALKLFQRHIIYINIHLRIILLHIFSLLHNIILIVTPLLQLYNC